MNRDIFNPQNLKFSLERALLLARMSALAYKPVKEISADLKESGFKPIFVFEQDDTEGFICTKERSAFLIFRGTEKTSPRDWLTDFNVKLIACGRGKVHQGVSLALDRGWNDIENKVRDLCRRKMIFWAAGHSLGGALAMLSFFRLSKYKLPLAGLYTFGQPRLGNNDFSENFNRTLRKFSFRFVNEGDITACVPPRLLGYRHSGRLMYLDRCGKLHKDSFPGKRLICRSGEKITRAQVQYSFLKEKFPESMAAHRISTYIALMEKNIFLLQK